jgi:hypothetical protein
MLPAKSYKSLGIAIMLVGLSPITDSCSVAKHGKKQNLMPGVWQTQPVAIDGDSKDWPSPYPNYDSKSLLAYATSNDRENLYITAETGDLLTQIKILSQGMVVSIDTGGGKDATFKIAYPLQNDNDPLELPRTDDGQVHMTKNFGQQLAKQAEKANQLSLEGFTNCGGGYMVAQNNACGIKVMARIDEYKQLVWEAKVPFKALYNRNEVAAAGAGKPISVCFAIKGFKDPDAKNKQTSTSSMSDPMGGNQPGRNSRQQGMPTGGQNTTNNPLQHLYESTKTWKHFKIAYQ